MAQQKAEKGKGNSQVYTSPELQGGQNVETKRKLASIWKKGAKLEIKIPQKLFEEIKIFGGIEKSGGLDTGCVDSVAHVLLQRGPNHGNE